MLAQEPGAAGGVVSGAAGGVAGAAGGVAGGVDGTDPGAGFTEGVSGANGPGVVEELAGGAG